MKNLLFIFLFLLSSLIFSQPPNISYNNTSTYFINSSNMLLTPTNSGGIPTYRTSVSTYTGNQSAEFSSNNPNGFSWPIAIVVSNNNVVYAADSYWPCIRKISSDGTTSILAGKRITDIFPLEGGSVITGYSDGQGSDAQFNGIKGLAVDNLGNLYVADCYNHRIRKVTPNGYVTTIAGNNNIGTIDGQGDLASFSYPYSLCLDNYGNVYVLDLKRFPDSTINSPCVIRKIDSSGYVTTIAGSIFLSSNNDGQGSLASFNYPKGITIDESGNLFVADSKNNSIRKITSDGFVTTFVSGLNNPIGICLGNDGYFYVTEEFGHQIKKISYNGEVTWYAGVGYPNPGSDSTINGLGNVASFYNPNGIDNDAEDNLYIADKNNQRIRKVILLPPYTISPNLPLGLNFNPETGVISGIPTETTPLTTYTITAANYYGISTTNITFSIISPPNCITPTVWNGTEWSLGVPNSSISAQINGPLIVTSSNSFSTCNLIVNSDLTINNNGYIEVVNNITVDNTVGNFLVKSGGKLIPKSDNSLCIGDVTVQRTTPFLKRFDYTYWSSPVNNPIISSVLLPTNWWLNYTFTFNTNNFYDIQTQLGSTITTGPDGQDDDGNAWQVVNPNNTFIPSKGYASMVFPNGIFPRTETVSFTGPINTGVIEIPLMLSANSIETDEDFNLIGNPYSSSIFADDFINTNINNISGTLAFWTHSGTLSSNYSGLAQLNYSALDYAYYNLSSGVAASFGGRIPSEYIGTGQGFLVEAENTNNIIFRPSFMAPGYSNNTNNTFFRNYESKKLWLSISTDLELFSQQLINYTPVTTLNFDKGYDLEQPKNRLACKFYSIEKDLKYKIQARENFEITDIVKLGYFTAVAETYTIKLDSIIGINEVYIKDNGVIHSLPYTFTTEVGEFNNRFELVYINNDLNIDYPEINKIIIYPNPTKEILYVENYTGNIKLFDLLGREYYFEKNIHNNKTLIYLTGLNKGTFILQIENKCYKIILY